MIRDGKPYITHDGAEYQCYLAGYYNPVQHKWHFVIDGIDNPIRATQKIEFMGVTLTVTHTCRREAVATSMLNNTSGHETYIEAWLL